jgi:hypothetical protein
MTQQKACEILWCWQELRDRTPAERIRILVERKMLPPDNDNEDQLECVRREMERADG